MKPGKIIGFYKKRFIFFGLSLAIMLAGVIAVMINGVTLDIQFKGGALLKYTYVGTIDENIAADVATEQLGRPVTTQLTKDITSGEVKIVFNVAGDYGVDAADQSKLDDALKAKFPDAQLKLSESQMVEKYFGDKFLRNGIIALVLSTVLVLIYVWIRFNLMGGLSAGVMAVVALIHDVFVVFFTCVIFKLPIGDSFVAVALSIIGYSINDTIVIYDRIRENAKSNPELKVDELTDLSISQSIMRSVMTNLCVMLSVSLVYVLAFTHNISSIQAFALPMAIGSISGCYSTICIAGPLWVMWKKTKGDTILFKEKTPEKAKIKSNYKY
jgi:preprotein translocase subunit SecF